MAVILFKFSEASIQMLGAHNRAPADAQYAIQNRG